MLETGCPHAPPAGACCRRAQPVGRSSGTLETRTDHSLHPLTAPPPVPRPRCLLPPHTHTPVFNVHSD
eukprot:2173471-Pyramimonas_sp.AAC.1